MVLGNIYNSSKIILKETFLGCRYIVPQVRINKWALSLFTFEKIKRYAKETGIDLGLLPPKGDPLTKTEKEGIKEMENVFDGAVKFLDKDKNRDV